MEEARQYAVLGPMESGAETRALLGCEVVAGTLRPDLPVVIVWLPDELSCDPNRVAHLQREMVFVAQLDHPHIMKVHGLERFEDRWARVVSFADGASLAMVVARVRGLRIQLDLPVIARIVLDACAAVLFAHESGRRQDGAQPLVHGGLRPDTLLITPSGRTMVTGYGAAAFTPEASAPRGSMYLAPEQLIGGLASASPSTDVYALGAILYELLAGHPPFFDEGDLERAVLSRAVQRVDRRGLAPRLDEVVVSALAKRSADRFSSVRELAGAVQAALAEVGMAVAGYEEVARVVAGLVSEDEPERARRLALLESARRRVDVTAFSDAVECEPRSDRSPTGEPEGRWGARVTRSPGRPSWQPAFGVDLRHDPDTVVDRVSDSSDPDRPAGRDVVVPKPVRDLELPSFAQPVVVPTGFGEVPAAGRDQAETHGAGSAPLNPSSFLGVSRFSGYENFAPASREPAPRTSATVPALSYTSDLTPPAVPGVPPGGFSPETVPEPAPPHAVASERTAPARSTTIPTAAPPAGMAAATVTPSAEEEVTSISTADLIAEIPADGTGDLWREGSLDLGAAASVPARAVSASTADAAHPPKTGSVDEAGLPATPLPHAPGIGSRSHLNDPSASATFASGEPEPVLGRAGLPVAQHVPGRGGAADLLEGPTDPPEVSVITAFHRRTGDGSRSVIFLVGAAAIALLAFMFAFPKEPPEGIDQPSERSRLPPELVRAALQKKTPALPAAVGSSEVVVAARPAPRTPDAGVVVAVQESGRLSLSSEPLLSVFDGSRPLGRTPLTAKLTPGAYRLRFTDRKTGINFYKHYRIRPGSIRRDHIELGTGTLVVHAPEGAAVSLNARRLGKAPMDPIKIYEGEYLLRVSYEGMRWAERFEAGPGQTVEYTVTLRN